MKKQFSTKTAIAVVIAFGAFGALTACGDGGEAEREAAFLAALEKGSEVELQGDGHYLAVNAYLSKHPMGDPEHLLYVAQDFCEDGEDRFANVDPTLAAAVSYDPDGAANLVRLYMLADTHLCGLS